MTNPKGLLALICITTLCKGVSSLRDVQVRVQPSPVEANHNAIVFCDYDLESHQLYSVQFYRGQHEFYRYSPSEKVPTKVFPFPDSVVKPEVDLSQSNQSQVYLRNVSAGLAGSIKCEVTADKTFTSAVKQTELVVVVRPDGPPTLETQRGSYDPRETLVANCTSRPSRPPAEISYALNGRPVAHGLSRTVAVDRGLGLNTSVLPLSVVLTERDFDADSDRLNLTCVAAIPGLEPKEYTSVVIGRRTPHPRPERVMYPNIALKSGPSFRVGLVVVPLLHLFFSTEFLTSAANVR